MKNRIAEVRKSKGLTQQELADKLNKRRPNEGKVYREHISQIESGKRGFSSKMIEVMAEVLGVEIGDLFFTSDVSSDDTKRGELYQ